MERFDFPMGGLLLAAGVAGPIFMSMIGVGQILAEPAAAKSWWDVGLIFAGLLPTPLIAFTIPIGFVIAILPAWGGTVVMHSLSWQFEFARYRIVWAVVGAVLPAMLVGLQDGPHAAPEIPIALILTGAICAAICRGRSKPASS